MFNNQGFADELMKFIYSQQTANVLLQSNPQTKELDKILLRFDQLWFRYFPHGRISPADWVLPPADEIDISKPEQSRKQYYMDRVMWKGRTNLLNQTLRTSHKGL